MRYSQRQREHCCHVMPKDSNLVSFEIIALVICGNDSNRLHSKKMQTWCDHYQRSYHTKETYWKLHGKLLDWVPNRKKRKKEPIVAIVTDSPSTSVQFSKAQMNHLCNFLAGAQAIGTSLMAQFGSKMTNSGELWIIYLGTIDHMTGCECYFQFYKPSSR